MAGLEVVAKDGEVNVSDELPAYVQFANTCLYCEPGAQFTPCGAREKPPSYAVQEIYRPDVVKTIETELDRLDSELRKLSLDIWNHPEIMYQEKYAHDTLTAFMSSHGFTVSPHYLGLSTAFRAAFSHTSAKSSVSGTRVLGVNAEMDALPGIGHACGHNLIAMSGVAVALALKAALQAHDISGTVVLLGTPAEEGGGGKIALLERGAYDEMDACVMCHPSPGPDNWTALGPSLACQPIEVEYFGHGAHAAASPWEAQNALDAAFLAYAGISALRQQMKPTHRVHGVVSGRDWAPNVIPDYAKMRYIVRAPTWGELETLRGRVKACFEAAAHATACKIEIKLGVGYFDLRQNGVLGQEYANFVEERYGMTAEVVTEGMRASTDFGNVTYALPAIHPSFAIPTEPNGGNHTPQFARAAATPEAHAAALTVAKGLAAVGMRVLDDGQFARAVKKAFEDARAE
ncbi:Peptidase M20 domain-containing protein 2 [Grifola frondosa]|uniref:Peptidase M20 domain-containing protein 2 n=1 Tax=Grifola frondosa TaxID=5627 RepID=A0A1C7M2A8_GRIFR|nr:Peptidase M20 domain-containing protein 2 [Grifola frondosa]